MLFLHHKHALQLLLLLLKRYVRALKANDLVRLHRRELADLHWLGWFIWCLLSVYHRRLDLFGAHGIRRSALDCLLLIEFKGDVLFR